MRLTNRDEPSQSADTRNNTETPRNGASAHARVGVRERAKERERGQYSVTDPVCGTNTPTHCTAQ